MIEDLTIIIPARNRLWALPKAVESCRSSGLEVQVILVDDGSSDGTAEWLATQPWIESIRLDGWGKPFAINRAFPFARGEFIRFLDSDDWFPDGTLQEQVLLARKKSADLVVAGYVECSENGDRLVERSWIRCDDFISQQLGECEASHYSAFTFRRSFVCDIPHRSNFPAPQFATRDDRCFMLEVAMREPRIEISERSGLCHRHHGRSRLQRVSGFSADAANLNLLLVYQTVLSQLEQNGALTTRRRKAASEILNQVAEWLSDRELPTALSLLDVVDGLQMGESKNIVSNNSMLEKVFGRRNYFKIRSIRRAILDLFPGRYGHRRRDMGGWLR